MQTSNTLYDEDFYLWTQQQAALLRDGKGLELDYANLAEEIESLGRSDKRELGNRLSRAKLARYVRCAALVVRSWFMWQVTTPPDPHPSPLPAGEGEEPNQWTLRRVPTRASCASNRRGARGPRVPAAG